MASIRVDKFYGQYLRLLLDLEFSARMPLGYYCVGQLVHGISVQEGVLVAVVHIGVPVVRRRGERDRPGQAESIAA